jgi:hypothetical protein
VLGEVPVDIFVDARRSPVGADDNAVHYLFAPLKYMVITVIL